ncbi:MAG: lytic transglycosylase domain-containing protein [Caulobacteraceae bacterium]|nr:lytic transglycosylase domain-containing protein [Caulobacteraceae bacterium]
MVRPILILLLAALAASPATSATGQSGPTAVDWRAAGGGLTPGIPSDDPTPSAVVIPAFVAPAVQPWAEVIAEAAAAHGLDEKLLHALVVVESAYRPDACSPVGACGLAQLMPATARELGIADRFDPVQNLHGGARYLADQIARFGDLRLALAAYNAGPGRVARLGRVPDIPETRAYVVAVVDCYLALTAGRAVRTARDCRPAAP